MQEAVAPRQAIREVAERAAEQEPQPHRDGGPLESPGGPDDAGRDGNGREGEHEGCPLADAEGSAGVRRVGEAHRAELDRRADGEDVLGPQLRAPVQKVDAERNSVEQHRESRVAAHGR